MAKWFIISLQYHLNALLFNITSIFMMHFMSSSTTDKLYSSRRPLVIVDLENTFVNRFSHSVFLQLPASCPLNGRLYSGESGYGQVLGCIQAYTVNKIGGTIGVGIGFAISEIHALPV